MHAESTYDEAKVIAGSELDGWTLGYVGIAWPGPWPKLGGDLFVTDPIGGQAGLAWESSGPSIAVIGAACERRWGVFQVRFPLPVMSERDLIRNFHLVLPLVKQQRTMVKLANPDASDSSVKWTSAGAAQVKR